MNGYCSAFGHREFYKDIEKEMQNVIEKLIIQGGITVFLTGGMGDFDYLFSSTVRLYKTTHKEIKLILVKPYFSNEINRNREYYENFYDDIIIPSENAVCHYKAAITKRNRWMINRSDIVLSAVYRDFGGAHNAVKYAEKINKQIINLC